MLELLVLVFHRALQPVLAVEIHHDATLVEAMMTLGEIGLHHEAEELLAGLHLQNRGVVVLEVIVRALPKVGLWCSGDKDGITLHLVVLWLACPLKAVQSYAPAVGKCFFNLICKLHCRFLLFSLLSASHEHHGETKHGYVVFSHIRFIFS